jgi:hypothetical protein
MLRKVLLACGAISSLLYIAVDVVAALAYPAYHSFTAQAISELTANGAPTKGLVDPLFVVYNLLVVAFAVGLWMSVRDDRLRVTAVFVAAIGLVGLIAGPFSEMSLRGSEWMLTDTLHIAATAVIVLCIFGGVMFATAALGPGFFRYSIGTLVTLAVFGLIAGLQGVRPAVGEPTPWFGVVEQIHIGAYLLWMAILAVTVWPARRAS